MAELWRRCLYPPHEIGPRLALLLDLALETGKPPPRLVDPDAPDSWSVVDLELLSQWKQIQNTKCPGCGRPISQHLHNPSLGREETPDDYIPHSLDCPAMQAIASGQEMWKAENKPAIDSHMNGKGADPGMGVYWLSQGHRERLPQPAPTTD